MGKYATKQRRILIVDDDIDLLMLLERLLQKQYYIVETAASLAEAEEIIDEFQPDIVLLDINVNGDDGRQLCWKVKNGSTHPIKVLIMSGYDVNTGRALLFGADEVLAKPLMPEYLLKRIETHLGIQDEFSPVNFINRKLDNDQDAV